MPTHSPYRATWIAACIAAFPACYGTSDGINEAHDGGSDTSGSDAGNPDADSAGSSGMETGGSDAGGPDASDSESSEPRTYLLLGQSNMVGRGRLKEVDAIRDPRIMVYDPKASAWVPATDPLPFTEPPGKQAGVGPALSFAAAMLDSDGAPIRLVPVAVGGSALSEWQPGGALYERTISYVDAGGARASTAGILWHQGESDASTEADAANYGQRLRVVIQALRVELGDPELPFVAGLLGEFTFDQLAGAASINRQLQDLEAEVSSYATVDSRELNHRGDKLHFDASSQRELGRRYAQALLSLEQ